MKRRGGRVVLHHGTTLWRARSIIQGGPDPQFREPGTSPQSPPAEGFSTAPPDAAGMLGKPVDYAILKASLFPNEGGPAIVEIEVPDYIVNQALIDPGDIRFEPGAGLEALLNAWDTLPKTIIVP